MTELIILAVASVLSLGLLIQRWRIRNPSKLVTLLVTALYCVTLLLALRFGARTYPGLYFPDYPALSGLLNSSWLFDHLGYGAVLVAGLASVVLVLASPTGFIGALLSGVKWIAASLAMAIAFYGLCWAMFVGRLP